MADTVVATAANAPRFGTASWKHTAASVCAILLGLIFLISGGWKLVSPLRAGELLEQAQVPAGLGVLGAAALGVLELLAAFLLFVPRFRRWGGLLGSALLLFFIGWIAYYYPVLVGHECSCFPIVKRTVGPGFFIGDAVMLLMGLAAFAWSPRARGWKVPVVAFTALTIAAGASVFAHAALQQNAQVPVPVVVDGKPQNLAVGKVFLFFYDPSCMHCDAASKFMSTLNWGDTRIVAIPTINPQWAASFLHDTKLKASTSLELDKLKKAFPFVDPPFGVALENGRVKETFGQAQFNEPLPAPDLKKLGFVK
ncbi:MAG TPA: MauE/DoxX family redox-associated membrane protein [Bryobacteraceae bacterium]|nr:MauE/DoxX family redox-associated membrane protein [Bryobacteraceae bacterium]HTW67577.1 MauE/DoxX family redox-associated membrane protein [Bryobacteraceae bacterium]